MARTQQDPARAEVVQGEVRATVLAATVIAVLPNRRFRLRLPAGAEVDGHVGGDLRMGISRIVPGDRVRVELSPLDPGKARITGRASKSIHQRGQP